MKNSKNNNVKNVPSIHTGCSMAETGYNDYDDFDHPLKALDIIPEGKEIPFVKTVDSYSADGEDCEVVGFTLPPEMENPSSVREEPLVTVVVPSGVHPITFLKEKGVDIENSWIFMNDDVADVLRKMPYRYHQATVAYGEFFRFENFDTISLQSVKYFDSWKVLLDWEFDGKKFERNDTPECIIEVVMEK